MEKSDFDQLVTGLINGDKDAWEKVWNEFQPKILDRLNYKLRNLPKRVDDPEDVAVSVFRTMFDRLTHGKIANFESTDKLLNLFLKVSSAKAALRWRHYYTIKNGHRVTKTVNERLEEDLVDVENSGVLDQVADRIVEQMEDTFGELNDRQRQIVILKLEGYKTDEIAKQIKRSHRTVQREIENVEQKWDLKTRQNQPRSTSTF